VLSAARESAQSLTEDGEVGSGGRVIAVMQPHRYSRLEALMDDFQSAFNDADIVLVAPVYPAGEEPIDGVDSATLVDGLRARGHRMVKPVADVEELASSLRDIAAAGDIVVCMGAGDITKWAAGLADGIGKARVEKSPASPLPPAGGVGGGPVS
jgi:UDP-N-acetylmuramate--alanine ligase